MGPGRGRSRIPTGFHHSARRCEGRATPGLIREMGATLKGLHQSHTYTAHDDGRAIESVEDATDVVVHLLAERTFAQEGPALFGGEHNVQENLGEGLRHGTRMLQSPGRFNPFRGMALT